MEQWTEKRLNHIGASEIGSLFSCNPYTNIVQLWEYKTREKAQKEIDPELSKIGHEAEAVIIEDFKKTTGMKITHNLSNKHFVSKDYNYLACTPDAYNNKCILQCKTYRLMKSKGRTKWTPDTIPFSYILQTLQEMIVMNVDVGYLGVQYFIYNYSISDYVAGDIEFFKFDRKYYKWIEDEIVNRGALFWENVKNREVPNYNNFKRIDE